MFGTYDKSNALESQYQAIADAHMQHDLTEEDRQALKQGAAKLGRQVTIGAAIGSGVMLALGFRAKARFVQYAAAARSMPRPVSATLADGRQVDIPPLPKVDSIPQWPGWLLVGIMGTMGMLVGAETGLLTGAYSAKKTLEKQGNMDRIRMAFRKTHADVLRKEADAIEQGVKASSWEL